MEMSNFVLNESDICHGIRLRINLFFREGTVLGNNRENINEIKI